MRAGLEKTSSRRAEDFNRASEGVPAKHAKGREKGRSWIKAGVIKKSMRQAVRRDAPRAPGRLVIFASHLRRWPWRARSVAAYPAPAETAAALLPLLLFTLGRNCPGKLP